MAITQQGGDDYKKGAAKSCLVGQVSYMWSLLGTPVGAHVIKMMGYIQTLEKQGFALNNKLVTDVILQSLSDSFKQFILNFNMNDIDKTLPQLLGMLRTAKSNLKKNGSNSIQIVRVAKERERKGQSLRVMESPNPKKGMH
ncbi:hypothetical protein V6N12_049143 [Hibiscus sabdariffa]|uniref:Uncharacterized protein n=1 Tax=Hibiscus sabdariffa TaxID=183260 RepID=A0ABR2EJB7_9ROSI